MTKVKKEASESIEGHKKQYESKLKKHLKKIKVEEKENAFAINEDKYQIQQLTK